MNVLFQTRTTIFSVPGGDTTQLLKTKEYLEKLGVNVDISNEFEPDLSKHDLVHVFNLMRPQDVYLQVMNAKRQNKPVALSTIYGLYTESEKYNRKGVLKLIVNTLNITQVEYLKVIARAVMNGEFNRGTRAYILKGHKRMQRKIVENVDVFLPNSDSEMKRVAEDFGLKDFKYVAVPNAADTHKFDYDKTTIDPANEKYRDCILCVSRIEGRKNQLNVVRALNGTGYHVVFIGKPGPNGVGYYNNCVAEAGENIEFIGHMDHELLPQFYKLARVHVLASWMETPGLSSIEAGAMKTNIVATKKGDPEEYFGDLAYYCEPDDVGSIRDAVVSAYNDGFKEELYDLIVNNYAWEHTAEATLKGYNMCLKELAR